ncbi:MAG: carbohydrate ABC transporter permease [Candidatus Brocadiia bacterium]
MPVLTKVEAKGWRGRLFLTGVTLALIIGGATMVYPFLLMMSGAMRSNMDSQDMGVVPKFLTNDKELVRKFLETKYNYDPILMNRFRQTRDYSFRDAWVPEKTRGMAVEDLNAFVRQSKLPDHWQVLGGTVIYQQIGSLNQRKLVDMLRDRFDGDLDAFNSKVGAPIPSWWQINARTPRWGEARAVRRDTPLWEAYLDLMRERPPAERAFVNLTGLFLERLVFPEYGRSKFEAFQKAHDLNIESYEEFSLPQRVPPPRHETLRKEWLQFVFEGHLNMSFVRSDASDEEYRAFLREQYKNIDDLNLYWHTEYKSFENIELPGDREWVFDYRRGAYRDFLKTLKPESLRLVGPEFAWRSWLQSAYDDIQAVSKAHNMDYADWQACKIPLAQLEKRYVLDNSGTLRRRYAGRNFRIVFAQMFVQGRPFLNTIIYVVLGLFFSLTVMPLVAYALSRFKPPGMWKIIFIFVATMAFPPMVSMIPRFLIIKKLGLLNTFIALVLPLTINGMLIFLLKGFFDSIPQDLYDAAVIDGASEFRIFWQITMAMSKPILAVVALQTFNRAWRAFLYPLIVCPDKDMHVLAVWLQQFQLEAPGTAVFASILIASIPSLLIFLFAQRTIMRGIAVPSEK